MILPLAQKLKPSHKLLSIKIKTSAEERLILVIHVFDIYLLLRIWPCVPRWRFPIIWPLCFAYYKNLNIYPSLFLLYNLAAATYLHSMSLLLFLSTAKSKWIDKILLQIKMLKKSNILEKLKKRKYFRTFVI